MAKAATAKAPKAKKKNAKALKAVAKAAPAKAKKAGKKPKNNASDTLWKLAEHPLIGELLAVGATAAVAALAEQGSGKKRQSSRTVKAAGKAAAAAIGARLISEFTEGAAKQALKPSKS